MQKHLRTYYIIGDFLAILVGMVLFNVVRYFSLPHGVESRDVLEWLLQDHNILEGLVLVPAFFVAVAGFSGYYNTVIAKSRLQDLQNAFVCGLVTTLVVYFSALINDYLPRRVDNYILLIELFGLMSVPVFLIRSIINWRQRRHLRAIGGIYPTVLISPDHRKAHLLDKLKPVKGSIPSFKIIKTLNPESTDFEAELALLAVDRPQAVIVDTPKEHEILGLLGKLYPLNVAIFLPVDLYSLITSRTRMTNVVSEPVINVTRANISELTLNAKRVIDIAVSAVALTLLSPLMAVIALAIKLDSPGPVFYSQERVGYHKKLFRIKKFRTMQKGSEPQGPALSSPGDPRITRVGAVLRKYRLDEIPQFWNTLVGEMSLVGPRPERQFFVDQIIKKVPHYSLVHQVRPGITSWGMVKYGYASSVDQMIKRAPYDILYIDNVSLSVDLKILFHTVRTVLTGKGV